jgi:predicted outer membrane repeat protein
MRNSIYSRQRSTPLVEALDSRILLKTIFVDANGPGGTGSSWTFPTSSLQQAFSLAIPGDQIRVADGVYKPTTTTDRAATFALKAGVTVQGGYAGFGAPTPNARDVSLYPSILSGEIGSTSPDVFDNSIHVVTASNIGNTAVLDGFTITAGQAGGSNTADADYGSGMLIRNAGPAIINCTFTSNRNAVRGIGVFVGGFSPTTPASPTFTNCRFTNNGNRTTGGSGGALYAEYGAISLTDCVFDNNASYNGAGAVHLSNSAATLAGCTFTNNWARYRGAALTNDQIGNLTATNCTFSGNITELSGTVTSFGASYSTTSSAFTDCTFTENSASNGGAFYVSNDATVSANRCDFVRNRAGTSGGAVYTFLGRAVMTNSRFLGNTAGAQYPTNADGGAIVTAAYAPEYRAFIANCEFVGNQATRGGAIRDIGAYGASVTNCTFTANSASSVGGAVEYAGGGTSAGKLANSILWNNTAPTDPQLARTGTPPTVSYSNIQGTPVPNITNIDSDPLFVRSPSRGGDNAWGTSDDDYGDLRLQIQSLCVDAGSFADGPQNYPTDVNGAPRFYDFPGVGIARPAPDMGAHELNLRLGLLRLADDETLALADGKYTYVIEQFQISPSAQLDIRQNSLVFENAEGAAVEDLIRSGYHQGDWLGAGIVSSAAAADSNFHVGVADNAALAAPFGTAQGGPLFDGIDVDDTCILVKFTHRVDLNLDGPVNDNDSIRYTTNYEPGADAGWSIGDLNMDGVFSDDDAILFATYYDTALPQI